MKIRRSHFLLASICLLALGLCACGGFSEICNTIIAVLGGVGVVITTLGALLSPAETAALQEADTLAIDGVQALENTVNAYEADKTGTGLVADVQAAIAAVKQTLAQLLAAAAIKNAALQAWITKIVNLVSEVVSEVVTDILPAVSVALTAGDTAKLSSLSNKCKALARKLRADHDAALDASGLPADAIKAAHDHVNHKLARHIGPARI